MILLIERIEIENFQSLKKVSFDFGKITVLTGPSNLGKSAVVRALNTLIYNEFNTAYVTKGKTFLSISLYFDSNHKITFNRDGSTTYYEMDGILYEKVAGKVPEPIQKALNMEKIPFDKDLLLNFNFQKQFDPPFLISNSGFEVAKVFGKLMDIDLILASSRQITIDTQNFEKQISILEINKKNLTEQLQDVDFINIEQKYSISSLIEEKINNLQEVENKVQTVNEFLNKYQHIHELLIQEQNLLKLFKFQSVDSAKLSKSISFLTRFAKVNFSLIYFQSLLERSFIPATFNPLQLEKVLSLLKSLASLKGSYDGLNTNSILIPQSIETKLVYTTYLNIAKLFQANKSQRELQAQKENLILTIQQNKESLQQTLASAKLCPITGLPFKDSCIEVITK